MPLASAPSGPPTGRLRADAAREAQARPRPGDHMERWQRGIAALATGLLHLSLLLLAWWMPPLVSDRKGGSAAGALQVVDVEYVGEEPPPPPAVPPPSAAPAASRLRTTPVVRAEERAERESPEASEALRMVELPPRETRPEPPAPVTPPHPPARRSAYLRGMPPGLLPEDQAPVNAGTAPSPDVRPGPRYQADASESELEAGGYQVIYDLIAERRVREWRDAGMTEVYMPLPGTRRLMACPLEIVMRRSSGPCRLVEPDDPALANIGDAREVLSMLRIYHRGQPVWRGPGPYR